MIQQIHPLEVKAKLDSTEPMLLLDVRQPEEYAICKLANSQLIPLGELPRRIEEVEIEPGTLIVVYCHHGVRSLSGAKVLTQAGVPNVVSLAGGIEAWSVLVDPTVPRY